MLINAWRKIIRFADLLIARLDPSPPLSRRLLIFLIHGGFAPPVAADLGWLLFRPILSFFNKAETHSVHLPGWGLKSMPANHAAVKTMVESVRREGDVIILVGHSLGGQVARDFAENGGRELIDLVFTLDTPGDGSKTLNLTHLGLVFGALRELEYDSEYCHELANGETLCEVHAFAAKPRTVKLFVRPWESAVSIAGARKYVVRSRHLTILFNPLVVGKIASIIEEYSPVKRRHLELAS